MAKQKEIKTNAMRILDKMRREHNIMITGSFGPFAGKLLRIGHMGANANEPDPRQGKIRRKSRNRKNINTKNIHFIDTSLLLPPILLSYHIKTCLFFVRIIFGHHRCASSRHTHIFRLSTRFVYRLYIHIIVKFTRFPHNIFFR